VAVRALTEPGTYALMIALDCACNVTIGRRGCFRFPAGFYLYTGSALGPGGLAGRLTRHLCAAKHLHWHVDYLLCASHACVVEVWAASGTMRRECDWARAAMRLPRAGIVVPRFGASDCRCAAHLVSFAEPPDWSAFVFLVGDQVQPERIECRRT